MRNHRIAFAALALPLLAGCSDLVSNQTIGPRAAPIVPSGGALFSTYIALGTSISAGVQSGGISDSTQKQSFPYLLAQAMGTTLGVNWTYPSFNNPGCPPPYTNPLTGARVTPPGYPASTSSSCYLLNPTLIRPFTNDLGVPSIRAAQVLNLQDLTYPATDTLLAAQFITGSRNPITELMEAQPTFVTLEIGANDVLGAATHGNAALLTPLAAFQSQFTAIADSLDKTGAKVAVANIPNVTVIPHFSAGVVFFCLKTGAAGCPVPATAPYSLATFTVDASCAPTAAGGVGDQMLVAFPATATITGTLAGGGAASLNCGAATATVTDLSGTHPAGAVLSAATVATIATEVVQIDAFIQQQANSRGWAYVDLNGLLAANAALIPKFPNFSTPATLFGVLFSLDGIHPNAAGHKAIASVFVAAINAKFTTTLTPP
jgi:lysophospholipase L1-like esterase